MAVVNEDSGEEMDGKSIDAGKELVAELADNRDFQWKFTDGGQDALNGVRAR